MAELPVLSITERPLLLDVAQQCPAGLSTVADAAHHAGNESHPGDSGQGQCSFDVGSSPEGQQWEGEAQDDEKVSCCGEFPCGGVPCVGQWGFRPTDTENAARGVDSCDPKQERDSGGGRQDAGEQHNENCG